METLWFIIIALMLTTYVVLDGFDLGAGVIYLLIAKTPAERRMVIRRIDLIAKSKDHNAQPDQKPGQHHQKNLVTPAKPAESIRTSPIQNNPFSIFTSSRLQNHKTLNLLHLAVLRLSHAM